MCRRLALGLQLFVAGCGLSLSQTLLWAQGSLSELPATADEANTIAKGVDGRAIPKRPDIAYEETRIARQKFEVYSVLRDQTIPQEISRLETAKATTLLALTHLQELSRDCRNTESLAELKQILQSLEEPAGLVSLGDETKLLTFTSAVRELRLASSTDACKALASDEEIKKLKLADETDTDKVKERYNQKRQFAQQLQKAWAARLAKLEDALTEELQAYAPQNPPRWVLLAVVLLIIGFAALMFLGLQRYAPDIQKQLISSGEAIQFPTVIILLLIICALAISKTIGENTVSALLGGISGYVLSQGVGRAVAARHAERHPTEDHTGATGGSAGGGSAASGGAAGGGSAGGGAAAKV